MYQLLVKTAGDALTRRRSSAAHASQDIRGALVKQVYYENFYLQSCKEGDNLLEFHNFSAIAKHNTISRPM